MIRNSKLYISTVHANSIGYKIDDNGVAISHNGIILKLSKTKNNSCLYYYFGIRLPGRIRGKVYVHKLAAYQKFGSDAFKKGIVIRHLDGNSLNNKIDNIEIGSQSDNMMDCDPEDRTRKSINASEKKRILSDCEVFEARALRKQGYSYNELMSKYNIKSKSSMWEILNRNYVTKK